MNNLTYSTKLLSINGYCLNKVFTNSVLPLPLGPEMATCQPLFIATLMGAAIRFSGAQAIPFSIFIVISVSIYAKIVKASE